MLKFIVKNRLPKIYSFVVNNELPRFLFLIRNRFYTDLVFLLDENNVLLFDENGNFLID